MLTNNNLLALIEHLFKAIFNAENTYNKPITIVAVIITRVIELVGDEISNTLDTNVKMENPINNIFDRNISSLSVINILIY